MISDKRKAAYKLHENIAAIAASVHADVRLPDHIDKTEQSFTERLEWCIEAAHNLVAAEPEDYEDADREWCDVTDAIADGFYESLTPDKAVEAAMNPAREDGADES